MRGGGLQCLKMSTQTFLMRVQPCPTGFAPTFTFTPRGQGCPPSAQVQGLCGVLWRGAPPCTLFSSWFCPGLPSSAQVAKGWTKNRICAAALAPAGCLGSSGTHLGAQGSLTPGKGDVREQPRFGSLGGGCEEGPWVSENGGYLERPPQAGSKEHAWWPAPAPFTHGPSPSETGSFVPVSRSLCLLQKVNCYGLITAQCRLCKDGWTDRRLLTACSWAGVQAPEP